MDLNPIDDKVITILNNIKHCKYKFKQINNLNNNLIDNFLGYKLLCYTKSKSSDEYYLFVENSYNNKIINTIIIKEYKIYNINATNTDYKTEQQVLNYIKKNYKNTSFLCYFFQIFILYLLCILGCILFNPIVILCIPIISMFYLFIKINYYNGYIKEI